MQPNSSLRRVGPGILVGGTAGIASAILTAAIGGSVFFQGNLVGDTAKNPNAGLLLGTRSIVTPVVATSTATGGLAKYDTIIAASPFNSTASTRGLKTGTGVVRYLQLDIVSNPSAVNIDCSVVNTTNTGTGGTALVTNASATGSTLTYSTPFTLGPTQYVKCGTTNTMVSGFSAVLRLIMGDTDVVN